MKNYLDCLQDLRICHKDASSALGAVNELTQVLQEAHLQALNHTQNNMSEIRGFLTQTLQEHKSHNQRSVGRESQSVGK